MIVGWYLLGVSERKELQCVIFLILDQTWKGFTNIINIFKRTSFASVDFYLLVKLVFYILWGVHRAPPKSGIRNKPNSFFKKIKACNWKRKKTCHDPHPTHYLGEKMALHIILGRCVSSPVRIFQCWGAHFLKKQQTILCLGNDVRKLFLLLHGNLLSCIFISSSPFCPQGLLRLYLGPFSLVVLNCVKGSVGVPT